MHVNSLAVRDDLIDRARLATARGLCKKLVHFGALPISGAKEIDKVGKMSLYYRHLKTVAPVAQLDRATDFESEGCRFVSCRARFASVCDTD